MAIADTSWQEFAACVNSPLDFVSEGIASIRACKAVCATCPVTEECAEYAFAVEDRLAVYGGMTYKERVAAGYVY